MRVVSLLPSATEMVALLGCADRLVGVSHECDFPPDLPEIPVITRSRLSDPGSSRSIDAGVRALISDALSIYSVDADALRAAAPDLVVTQDLCEVCAVSLDDVQAAVARLAHSTDVEILSLSPTRLGHVLDDLERVAAALCVAESGRSVRRALEARIRDIEARASGAGHTPRVASIEWLDPLMLGGTWMPELIEAAGGRAVGVEAGRPAPTVTLDELAALDPEVVVLKPCGFTIPRALAEEGLLKEIAGALAPGTRVYLTDGNAYFNRPGPRLVESLEILAACIHPEGFPDFASGHGDAIVAVAQGQ